MSIIEKHKLIYNYQHTHTHTDCGPQPEGLPTEWTSSTDAKAKAIARLGRQTRF